MTSDAGAAAPAASIFEMYRAMVGVGILCGVLIVTVYEVTRPIIARNRAEALQRAVFDVIPGARDSATFRLTNGQFEPATESEPSPDLVYAGYDGSGRLLGVALQARGMGYADVITILYGYSLDDDAIVGMKVLQSKETPGLGDKIEKDPNFTANFDALDASLNEAGDGLAHPITAVKSGEKEHPWEVDGITGATISSVAISNMLRDSAARWVVLLEKSEDQLQRGNVDE